MATILDLSPEIMSMVSSELRQVDLLNMSLTCKTINHAVTPDLYREYHDVNGGPIRKFSKLAKTLVELPELASHCRYIRWGQ
ncbi:hypothetical protein BS50DRAFT_578190 [Corynespora cassiicola Philippines]|uniref:F-box domain-containing protein n=1 Tax=Corynespora cassiicola Philippines TaxID=1448308 RepID=A0A2T2N861_CORCC|nr:hypothetical protein BS50DRAFT_578190 [Corynespora cassiicola Philippines]